MAVREHSLIQDVKDYAWSFGVFQVLISINVCNECPSICILYANVFFNCLDGL